MQELALLGIKTVINLRDDDERARAEGEEALAAGLRYFNVPLDNFGRPSDAKVERVLALIATPENQPVFVHCKRGADRTGTIIAIYRIAHDGWTSDRAKTEANQHGMIFWQVGMKDYIHDYYQRRLPSKSTQAKP
jgi:protein tyrosine/serine phosphatase